MKKTLKFVLSGLLLSLLALSGCASERENSTAEALDSDETISAQESERNEMSDSVAEQDPAKEQEASENERSAAEQETSDRQDTLAEWKASNELSDEEISSFTDFISSMENYGFLLSEYTAPADIDLNEVFYCGAGIATHSLTDDERAAYEQESGFPIELDVECITTTQINDFLLEKTGCSLEEMNGLLSWIYLEQYDSYVSQHGDTNYCQFICVGGKRIEEDIFEIHYQTEFGNNYGVLTLRKNGGNYLFVSNQRVYFPDLSGLSDEVIKQLEVFAENKDVWNMNEYESLSYSVVDLDNDGSLELIISAEDKDRRVSENHFYRTDDTFSKLEELPQEYYEENSEFDIAANIFERYIEAYTDGDIIYYPASDTIKDESDEVYSYMGAYYLKDGTVYSEILSYEFYDGMETITNPVFWQWIEPLEVDKAPVQKILGILAEKYKDDLEQLTK